LDVTLVSVLVDHFDEANEIRIVAQEKVLGEYEEFRAALV
jgi:hypothetical protein